MVKKQVSINDMLKQACETFMTQKVNDRGEPYDGYGDKYSNRTEWLAKKIGAPMYDDAIKRTVKDITDKVADQVQRLATAQLGERLAKLAGIPDLVSDAKK